MPTLCADGDDRTVRESRDWARITRLCFSLCLPQQILHAVSLFSSVTHLELSHSNVSDGDLTSLLPSLPPLLIAIHLSHNPLSSLPLRNLLLSTPLLQSLAFIGCRFSPSSLTSTAEAIRDHPNLRSIAIQVDGSASAVRLLQVTCNRPDMVNISIQAPYMAASQHVASFTFMPLLNIESIEVVNVPIQTSWFLCLLASITPHHASDHLVADSPPSTSSPPVTRPALQSRGGGLHCIRLMNNGACLFLVPITSNRLNSSNAFHFTHRVSQVSHPMLRVLSLRSSPPPPGSSPSSSTPRRR